MNFFYNIRFICKQNGQKYADFVKIYAAFTGLCGSYKTTCKVAQLTEG